MMSRFSSMVLILSMVVVSPSLAGQRSGISMRLLPEKDGDVCIGVLWEKSADEAALLLDGPEGVSILLPDGRRITAGRSVEVGPVGAGEKMDLRVLGIREDSSILITARRRVGEVNYLHVVPLDIRKTRPHLHTGRDYLVRPAEATDFPADEQRENRPENVAAGRVEHEALVIEAMNPKFANTVFAEDTASHAIDDGPVDCSNNSGDWQVTDILHIDTAPEGAVSNTIAVHIAITHPRMADLQAGFFRADEPYAWVWGSYLLKNDPGVNVDQTFTEDYYHNDFRALGEEVNGYYRLAVRDCDAGMTGTLTYYSVLITYDVPVSIDLVADSVHVIDDPAAPGALAEVDWGGHITGTGSLSGSFNVRLYLSNDNNITTADTLLETITVNSATDPGDNFGESSPGSNVTIPAGLSDGTYYIGMMIDPTDAVAETNESNNIAWDSLSVETPPDEYDLVADSLTPQHPSVDAGSTISVNWFGHLAGSSTASLGDDFSVGFYLSGDNNITTADQLLTRTTVSAPLDPGDSIGTSGFNLNIPGGTTAGNYYLGIIIDDTHVITETNENNNAASASFSVTGGGADLPDLRPSSCSPDTGEAHPGDSMSINWQGHNDGDGDAPVFVARLFLSPDHSFDVGSDTRLTAESLGPWSSGHSESIHWNFSIPSDTPPGSYYLIVSLDPGGSIDESDETNNECFAALTISESTGPSGTLRWLLPAAASAAGANSSDWKTQIAVSNPTTESRIATIYYVPDGWSWPGVMLAGPTTIAAHHSWYVDDILVTMNPTSGLLYVVLDEPGPVVTSRIYNLQTDGSTFGQGIPALSLDDGDSFEDFILPMVHSAPGQFHTNLGIVQTASGSISVRLDFFTSSGVFLTSVVRNVTDAWEQINDVFTKVGMGNSVVEGGWIQVHLESGDPGTWTAYASVVDDRTGDPTFIAGIPIR